MSDVVYPKFAVPENVPIDEGLNVTLMGMALKAPTLVGAERVNGPTVCVPPPVTVCDLLFPAPLQVYCAGTVKVAGKVQDA